MILVSCEIRAVFAFGAFSSHLICIYAPFSEHINCRRIGGKFTLIGFLNGCLYLLHLPFIQLDKIAYRFRRQIGFRTMGAIGKVSQAALEVIIQANSHGGGHRAVSLCSDVHKIAEAIKLRPTAYS